MHRNEQSQWTKKWGAHAFPWFLFQNEYSIQSMCLNSCIYINFKWFYDRLPMIAVLLCKNLHWKLSFAANQTLENVGHKQNVLYDVCLCFLFHHLATPWLQLSTDSMESIAGAALNCNSNGTEETKNIEEIFILKLRKAKQCHFFGVRLKYLLDCVQC